jgi:DNA-binding SARP family transcriptional activator/Tfp pilus assembly protein PilF
MDPALHFNYLGRFEILYQAGQPIEQLPKPPTQKSQSLLAYLVLHRQRPQSREHLMEMFWGERPPQRARRSLSTALWHIRRCFPQANPIQSDAYVVHFQFPGEVALDAEEFENQARQNDLAALQAALALYRGEFLPGFYDEWIIDERYRLQSVFEEVLARLMVLSEALGQYREALQAAQRLLEVDSLREDAHRLVMRANARLGRRNAALEQYQRCREIIARELGAEPMEETTGLYQSLLDGRFEIGSMDDTLERMTLPALSPASPGQNPFDANLPEMLVGREQEFSFLQTHWQDALADRVKLILVSGEAGVGKTQLVKWFAGHLQHEGIPILWGRCYEFERLLPYQPIAEALRPALANLTSPEIQSLPGWVVAGLARLIPELMENGVPGPVARAVETGKASQAGPGQEQTQLFHAIAHFLALLASTRPMLLVLEDLHWATGSTFELLHYLIRHLADQPVMVIGTCYPEALSSQHPLRAWQAQLRQEGLARQLPLSRLPLAAVETWVVQMAGAGEEVRPLARRLYEETEGNPFFVVEMIKALFELGAVSLAGAGWQGQFDQVSQGELPLPASIREVIENRMQRLPPTTQAALRQATVLGREFDFDLLNAIWQQGEEATLVALDDLLRSRLVVENDGAIARDYAFSHHKIQEVVYEGIPRRRRQRYHARTAQAIEALYTAQIDPWVSELAFHYEQGRQVDSTLTGKAVTYLRLAGEQAATQFANSEAADYLSRALTLTAETDHAARYDLLLALEGIHGIQGARRAQAQDLAVLEQLVQASPAGQRAEVALRRANYAETIGDYPAAIAAAKSAIPLAQASQSLSLEAVCCLQLGRAFWRQGDYEAARPQFEQALALARIAQLPDVEADALRNLGNTVFDQGDDARAATYLEQALAIFHALGYREGEANVLNGLGLLATYRGDYSEAMSIYEQTLTIRQEMGDRQGEALALMNFGYVSWERQDYAAARDYLEQALPISRTIGDRRTEGLTLLNLGYVSLRQASYTEAIACLEDGLAICREIGDRQKEGWGLGVLGYVFDDLGAYPAARSYFEQALRISNELGDRWGGGWRLTDLGQMSHHAGDEKMAHEYSQQALQTARDLDNLPLQVYALTVLGHALAGLGQLAAAANAYREAIAVEGELDRLQPAVEALAGLASLSLAEQNLAQAGEPVSEILEYLEDHTLEGTDEPFLVYLTCYRVLHALQDPRASTLLDSAYHLLQKHAETIGDEALRRSFLENVPAHRDLIAAFESAA